MGRKTLVYLTLLYFLSCNEKESSPFDEKLYKKVYQSTDGIKEIFQNYEDSSWKLEKVFWDNDTLMAVGYFLRNKKEGPFWMYYDNGVLASESHFSKGLEEGIVTRFTLKGKIRAKEKYESGIKRYQILYDSVGRQIDSVIFTR